MANRTVKMMMVALCLTGAIATPVQVQREESEGPAPLATGEEAANGGRALAALVGEGLLDGLSGGALLLSFDPLTNGLFSKGVARLHGDMRQLSRMSGADLVRALDESGSLAAGLSHLSGQQVISALKNAYLIEATARTNSNSPYHMMKRRYDSLNGVSFGEPMKRNFDEIDRTGFSSFLKKRNFDEIDRQGFMGFKRNFDEIDRSGFRGFI